MKNHFISEQDKNSSGEKKEFCLRKIQIICRINKNMPEPNSFLSLWEQLCIMMKHSPQTSLEMNMIRIIRNSDGKEKLPLHYFSFFNFN